MAKRDVMLKNFIENPLMNELCGLSHEELLKVSFSTSSNDPLVDALKRMIVSSVEKEQPKASTIKAVNIVLNNNG